MDRYEVGQSIGPSAWFLPDAIRSLWHYTYGAYRFHAGLTNADGQPPPVGIQAVDVADVVAAGALCDRPGERAGCGAQSCVKAVMLVGTPAMWFIAVPVLGWALWRAFVKRDWRYGAVLVGYGAGFLPWFADIDRQMYFFYAATMSPFLVMVIAMILRRHPASTEPECRAKNARADRRQLLCGACDHELRLDVSDPHGHADLAVDVEPADLAAQLAIARLPRRRPRRLHSGLLRWFIHSPRCNLHGHRPNCRRQWTASRACEMCSSAVMPWLLADHPGGSPLELPDDLSWRLHTEAGGSVAATASTVGAWLWSGRSGVIAGRAAAAMHGAQWVTRRRPSK